MAGPAMSAAKAVWVAAGDGVGVDEDSEVEGDALGVDGAAATTDVAVVAAGAAPVVEGPQPASRVRATTAKPATARAMGLRTITTPISGVDTRYGRSVCDPAPLNGNTCAVTELIPAGFSAPQPKPVRPRSECRSDRSC